MDQIFENVREHSGQFGISHSANLLVYAKWYGSMHVGM